MALVSPGVEVSVIDESLYSSTSQGTVPVIFVATASNKPNSSNTGIAPGTLEANAGKAYLLTSQRELGELFGDPIFQTDGFGNMIHASELNEYGLQTAYSILGVTDRAYVIRAGVDLAKIAARTTEPGGEPVNGAYWFNTATTSFGIFVWDSRSVAAGGQTFNLVAPIVITDVANVTGTLVEPGAPKATVGVNGDYAVVAITTMVTVWFKNQTGAWVEVGSPEWVASHATVTSTISSPTLTSGHTITINSSIVTLSGTTVSALATSINTANIAGITANVANGLVRIFSTGADVVIAAGTGTILTQIGLTAGTYYAPKVTASAHTQVPTYKSSDATPRPSGSIWVKTTQPNAGALFDVRRYNSDTMSWNTLVSPLYLTAESAIFNYDKTGGSAIPVGTLYTKANVNETANAYANYKIFRRVSAGATRVVSAKVQTQATAGVGKEITIQETVANSQSFSSPVTVAFTTTGAASDAVAIVAAINTSGLTHVSASVDSQNRIIITHALGGEIKFTDDDGVMGQIGFAPYNMASPAGTTENLYYAPNTDGVTSPNVFVASNWQPLAYTASASAPQFLTTDGDMWYNPTLDEVDIMIHDGSSWVGYMNYSAEYADTNATGPIISATAPSSQTDGTALVDGDLWIDTSDLENYPVIYKYNTGLGRWILVNNADQTTENGILFADARWATSGAATTAAAIEDLLVSDFVDTDAPDPSLYPKGMLLWNLRRSGFNVKQFVRNYVNTNDSNVRFGNESMTAYYPHRWVTVSGNNEDGSGTFGYKAQRKVVVQALQAEINSNQEIRDEEVRQFNIIAAPGYPELINELINLNVDRKLTALVVGDTPARLTPDATSIIEWSNELESDLSRSDTGASIFSESLAVYYPWGLTSDNFGNNIVVPPSHMALRTIILNDQVAYPWFAPAGIRRGAVTNASISGYVSSRGEFVPVSLNNGQRDTLYENNINPITFMSGTGLVVFGQKTKARGDSALDRVNVVRLVAYIRSQLEIITRNFIFEQNDNDTREQVKAAVDSFLIGLISLRGINDFLVVCDDTNNTPARIDRKELYVDVAIEPIAALEFVYIPIRIKNTGEISSL